VQTKKQLLFGGLVGISILLWWSAIAPTFLRTLHDDQYTYIFLIIPSSLAMIFINAKALRASSTGGARMLPGILLVAALCVRFTIEHVSALSSDAQLSISMAALVMWWIASFILCFGFRTFRIFVFPLCFLFGVVPFPEAFMNLLVILLQQYSAVVVNWMFQIVGIPVLRNGVILSIPGLTIEVAKECSSIRSSMILLISSMVLAQLFLRTKWRKTLVMVLAVPLSVVKNAVRIFTLSMLGIHVNRGFLTGRLHHQGGVVFYAGALIVIFLLVYWLQRRENAHPIPANMATVTK
jgi:exosortase